MIDIDGLVLYVSATDSNGVVGSDTALRFRQRGERIWATYSGGRIRRGWLVGFREGEVLQFRYAQVEAGGNVHGGRSNAEIVRLGDGRVRIVERFAWSTRAGGGVNIFDERACGDERARGEPS